ncbi:hypothetical protein F5Y04DRAFT_242242 [Hypomontagnella monticulosa]|nr:hypothetical protein F5Y04DRAFT_242242 [Hypomontagnella monticulosa]
MKFSALPNVSIIFAICASLVAALPVESEANAKRDSDCTMDKIRECVADTGLESTICFAQVCKNGQVTPKMSKRQDQCTEENLQQCTVLEWREAQVCFQELCL